MKSTAKITGKKIELVRNTNGILVARYMGKPSERLADAIRKVMDSGTLSI